VRTNFNATFYLLHVKVVNCFENFGCPTVEFSVADPGCLSIFDPKTDTYAKKRSGMLFIPDLGSSWIFFRPGSRGQKSTGSRIKIRNTGRIFSRKGYKCSSAFA
jgi:hypothetical protein